MSESISRPIRYVVFHKPGPKWQYGVELGGPFLLPDAGGMMVPTNDDPRKEMDAFAASDPAVQSGLLLYEIRPWFIAMEHK